ncbi:MAG TPA: ribosome-associated ATPase/putative transporter RbbA [Rhodopila sp.]
MAEAIAELHRIRHRYGDILALDDVSVTIPARCMAGLIGPDGVGKSTLLALASGVRRIQDGDLRVLGGTMRDAGHLRACHPRIAYMPQGLGRNLYPTLSVFENVDFFGRLFGEAAGERQERINELLDATRLAAFRGWPAAKLSGGMKQKLGLCCALIHEPDLLILDEPTTGVDPLSRRQFWELIDRIRGRRPEMSVIVATAYMEEAERFDWLAALEQGRVIASGTPSAIKARAKADTLESAFIELLPPQRRQGHRVLSIPPRRSESQRLAIEAANLTCRFGSFVAVNNVSFQIQEGEIFGFLGSNGCGKTTTMKMLTGLLPPTEGTVRLFGQPLRVDDLETRRGVGYMSQSFSLYAELTVRENLLLHAQLFGLPPAAIVARVAEMLVSFDLVAVADSRPEALPLGIRQRLQLAVAVVHHPKLLILDEPTSGVDPIARDQFWQYLIDLSRNQGVTIFISTHFMNEAMRCDRISLMHAGRVLAIGTPADLTRIKGKATLEDAFIAYLVAAGGDPDQPASAAPAVQEQPTSRSRAATRRNFDPRRLWAYARCESLQVLRDPIRLAFAFLGPLILMVTFGYGVSFDVEHLPYAVLDQDRSHESREFLEIFSGSKYFEEQPDIRNAQALNRRLMSGELKLAIEIPPDFGKDLTRGLSPEVGVYLDGAMPFRAETTRGYVAGAVLQYMADHAQRSSGASTSLDPVNIGIRFRYNQAFESVFAIVPGVIMLMLVLIPAMMTAVGVVREKETGSIANFRSSPVTRVEFLLGKQAPYVVIALISLALLVLQARFMFAVPVKGSGLALALGGFLYILAATGFGLLVSAFTRTQLAAMFATVVIAMIPTVNFSGLLVPVSSLSGGGRILGLIFPAAWFQQISVGTFTKGLGFIELTQFFIILAGFATGFIGLACIALRKQED